MTTERACWAAGRRALGVLAWASLLGLYAVTPAWAQVPLAYSAAQWADDLHETRWTSGAALATITAVGIENWDWGQHRSFHTVSEGWFGADTIAGGADKLGHAFSAYALTNLLSGQLQREGRSPERAAWSATLTTQALMLYVEVFDAFSVRHGFSAEDMAMNLLGSGLAYARTVHPRLRDSLDFRLEYQASGRDGFTPFTDYGGQKYLLAWKFGGMPALRDSPLRFFELQAGYYTRGYGAAERALGLDRSRNGFVGVGVNLGELFLGGPRVQESPWRSTGRFVLEHVQLPGVAARSERAF